MNTQQKINIQKTRTTMIKDRLEKNKYNLCSDHPICGSKTIYALSTYTDPKLTIATIAKLLLTIAEHFSKHVLDLVFNLRLRRIKL